MDGFDEIQGEAHWFLIVPVSEYDRLGKYESTLGQLTNAEILIDELKAQLDAAAAADELLLQLTDRNDILDEVR